MQKILGRLPKEPPNETFKHIQDIYVNQKWPKELANANQFVKDAEAVGLFKCGAICRYYSSDVRDRAELIDSAYRLKVLDGQDMEVCIPYLTKNQDHKYCSYILGSLLLNKYEDKGLEKLKFALDEVKEARALYCQTLLKKKRKTEIYEMLSKLPNPTSQDKFFLYFTEPDEDKSLEYLVSAAEEGLMEAQYNLGCAYLEGKLNGGNAQAVSWFWLAAFQNYGPAVKNLQQFTTSEKKQGHNETK